MRARKANPTKQEAIDAFGRDKLTELPGGKWQIEVNKGVTDPVQRRKNLQTVMEMTARRRALSVENGAELRASEQTEAVRGPGGRVEHLPAHMAERTAKKRGVRPLIRWGRPSEHMTYHQDGSVTREVYREGRLVRRERRTREGALMEST